MPTYMRVCGRMCIHDCTRVRVRMCVRDRLHVCSRVDACVGALAVVGTCVRA